MVASDQRGFSLLEFCVVLVVVSAVLVFFFDRVQMYQELAEKTAAELTAQNLRTSVRFRVAEMLLRHQERDIGGLVGGNPTKWLDLPLSNYAGEFRQDQLGQVAPESWYFDLDKGEIRYRIKRQRYFAANPNGAPAELRFRVTASSRKEGADGSVSLAEGVSLTLMEQYKWFYNSKTNIFP